MTRTVCDICGAEMPTSKFGENIKNLNFCISSYGKMWDICTKCRESLNRWMTIRKQQAEENVSENKEMTYGDIYNEFRKKFPNVEVEDYRPAVEMHIPQLSRGIPYAIIVWLKDGSKVIYIAEGSDNLKEEE